MSSSSSEDLSEVDERGRSMDTSKPKQEAVTKENMPVSVVLIPAPEQSETPVRINIDDLRLSSTIGEIRHRAQNLITSRPEIGRIRLIQSGRLLSRDDQALGEMVTFEQVRDNSTIPIHLILRPLPGEPRPRSVPRSASPLNPAVAGAQVGVTPGVYGPQPPVMPLFQGAMPGFPPRPSSTPAMPHPPGPYAVPGQPQPQPPGGFASHGVPGPQQAQFMQQLQQQHLNMMQAMLRPNPMQPQPGPPGHPMTLPDFQRMYNSQAQARQAQQAAMSGRTTPQPEMQPGRPDGAHMTPPNGPSLQNDQTHTGDSPAYQHIHGLRPIQQPPMVVQNQFFRPRVHMTGPPFQAAPLIGASSNPPINALSDFSFEHDTVYLLSSPLGHEAILVGPRGSSVANGVLSQAAGIQPPTTALAPQADGNNQQNQAARVPAPGQPLQMRDLLALMMPLGGHVWLIARLAGVVALLTLNSNWTRTIIIWSIAFIIYLAQTNVLAPVQRVAEQAWIPVRQHIEELVRDVEDHMPPANADLPEPAATAARLLRQQRAQRENSVLRRIERSVALFVASFVPGVGEAQIAAREAADRRRTRIREEEAREQEEEASRQREAENTEGDAQIQQGDSAENANTTSSEQEPNQNEPLVRQRQPHVEDVNE